MSRVLAPAQCSSQDTCAINRVTTEQTLHLLKRNFWKSASIYYNNSTSIVRKKRFAIVPFIVGGIISGYIVHKSLMSLKTWCDVVPREDITRAFNKDKKIQEKIDGVREQIISHHNYLLQIQESNNTFASAMSENLANVVDRLTFHNALLNLLILSISHYNKLQDACTRRVIPSNSIDTYTLLADLKKVQSEIHEHRLELAIPLERIEDYYKLRLCTCEFDGDKINIIVRIPLKPENARFKLFSPIYLPFKFRGQVCTVQPQNAILIEDIVNKGIHISSGRYLKECDLSTHLCKLHVNYIPNTDAVCLQRTFLSEPLEEVRELCPFVCTSAPTDLTLVNPIETEKYVVTNLPNNSYIVRADGMLTKLPYPPDHNGAFLLSLPCNSRLVNYVPVDKFNSVVNTIIDNSTLCSADNLTKTSTHTLDTIIPIQWLSTFNSSLPSFDFFWRNFTPLHTVITQSEFADYLKRKTNEANTHQSSVSSLSLTDKIDIISIIIKIPLLIIFYMRVQALWRRLIYIEAYLLVRAKQTAYHYT